MKIKYIDLNETKNKKIFLAYIQNYDTEKIKKIFFSVFFYF